MKKWLLLVGLLFCSTGFCATKAEVIADIQSQSYVARLVGEAQKVGMETDIAVYHQCYLEKAGEAGKIPEGQVKKIAFYVVDEGTDKEDAMYITGQRPNDSVTKAVEARTSLEAVKINA